MKPVRAFWGKHACLSLSNFACTFAVVRCRRRPLSLSVHASCVELTLSVVGWLVSWLTSMHACFVCKGFMCRLCSEQPSIPGGPRERSLQGGLFWNYELLLALQRALIMVMLWASMITSIGGCDRRCLVAIDRVSMRTRSVLAVFDI